MLHWHLLTGRLPALLLISAAVSGVVLLWAGRHARRWWALTVPSVVFGSALLTVAIDWYVEDVWRPFPDPLPTAVLIWIALIIVGIGLMAATAARRGWRRRAGVVVAALLVLATGLNQINREYGYYPNLAALLGVRLPQQVSLPSLTAAARARAAATPPEMGEAGTPSSGIGSGAAGEHLGRTPLVRSWRPSGSVPTGGVVSQVSIPGTVSHFSARRAWVYLPPAYLATPRPDLPVLMLIAGQPGNPENWIIAGNVITTMDRFAATHHGLAPIVLMPDATGSTTGNPLCIDSALGNAATYLSTDVVNWAKTHLQVDRAAAHWAVGGFSYGGTCAWQLAVAHPLEFSTFLNVAGSMSPTRGSVQLSADKAFHGDLARLEAAMPLTVMKADTNSPGTAAQLRSVAGTFVVGRNDGWHAKELEDVMRRCAASGITVRHLTEPGTHSWYVATSGLRDALPWLAGRMGLT